MTSLKQIMVALLVVGDEIYGRINGRYHKWTIVFIGKTTLYCRKDSFISPLGIVQKTKLRKMRNKGYLYFDEDDMKSIYER